MKKTKKPKWEKEKLKRLISAVYSAYEEPHSGISVINETTDFIDELHNQEIAKEKQQSFRAGAREVLGEAFEEIGKMGIARIKILVLSHKKYKKEKDKYWEAYYLGAVDEVSEVLDIYRDFIRKLKEKYGA